MENGILNIIFGLSFLSILINIIFFIYLNREKIKLDTKIKTMAKLIKTLNETIGELKKEN